MSGGFETKNDVFGRLARDLTGVADATGKAVDAMASRDGAGTLGTSDLDGAARDFKDTWSYGLGKLKEDLTDTTKQIVATGKQYETSEADITRALNQYRLPA